MVAERFMQILGDGYNELLKLCHWSGEVFQRGFLDAFIYFFWSPSVSLILAHVVFALIVWGSVVASKKFIDRELRKMKKIDANGFDKIVIMFSGVMFASIVCTLGAEFISNIGQCKLITEYVETIIMFATLVVLMHAIVVFKLTRNTEQFQEIHLILCRVTFLSFLIVPVAIFLTMIFYTSPAMLELIENVISIFAIAYYLSEIYISRESITKCFVIGKREERSMGGNFVEFINKNFVFILMLGMVCLIVLDHKSDRSVVRDLNWAGCYEVSSDFIIAYVSSVCRKMRDAFSFTIVAFSLQTATSWLVNRFIQKLDNLEDGKITRKPSSLRRKNLVWICDISIMFFYLAALVAILWYVGVDVQKYVFHDAIVTVVLIVFFSILMYNAFREFADAILEKAPPSDHEKIRTFMPVISIIFNVALVCISGLLVLSKLGVEIMPLLASFTAISAAIAIAAQDIVKGFLQGIILIFENNFYMGDFVTINGVSGTIVKIATRVLALRDVRGDIHFIPYHTISTITNHSVEFFCHNQSLMITPDGDAEKVSQMLRGVVSQMRQEPAYADIIRDDVNIRGVEAFSPDGIRINWVLKTSSSPAGRLVYLEVYRRLLQVMQKEKIKIPFGF